MYSEALDKSGHPPEMKYKPTEKSKRTRKRNIIWFNPPFSQHVKTNIGKVFLKLLDKNFPKHHKFHKLFNRNTVNPGDGGLPESTDVAGGLEQPPPP